MSRTLPISAAQSSLSQLVDGMVPGEELVLTSNGVPVAVVTRPARTSWSSQAGTAKENAFWMAPDFDAPLDDFAEYTDLLATAVVPRIVADGTSRFARIVTR